MMDWLRMRIGVNPTIENQAEEMLKAYGANAYAISSNLARDHRIKGDAEHARHWAKVAAYIAGVQKTSRGAHIQL
jgi:hypothetical protein